MTVLIIYTLIILVARQLAASQLRRMHGHGSRYAQQDIYMLNYAAAAAIMVALVAWWVVVML